MGLVYVLNTGAPSLAGFGFRLTNEGLEPLEGSLRELAPDADPAQVGFTPDGSALVVTERGTNSLAVFSVGKDGLLGDSAETPSAGPTPYGFASAANGALVVTEAFGAQKGKAAASSYRLTGTAAKPVSRSVGNGRSEICWADPTACTEAGTGGSFCSGKRRPRPHEQGAHPSNTKPRDSRGGPVQCRVSGLPTEGNHGG